ncbi:MAG: iron-only hydrogenase system regulator [Clostridia bacterium]|nr:iron-only hydrogenase system regulator [Clostridia bacterium]
MENKLSIIGIFIQSPEAVSEVNELLHSYADKIVGRMGLPYRDRGISVISIIIDAPADEISALAGKLGKIEGISAKTMQSKF